MYQGKFASKDKKGNLPRPEERTAPQNAQTAKPQPAAQNGQPVNPRPAAQSGQPVNPRPMAQNGRPMNPQGRPMPQNGRPMNARPAAQNGRPMNSQGSPMPQNGRPMNARPVNPQPMARNGQPVPPQYRTAPKRSHVGDLIFYIIFFACLLVIYTFTYFKLGDLQDWLVRYEAAQPTAKFQEVFDLYFKDPNWGLLYDNAGVPEAQFEGREEYVAYMEEKVGDTPLTGLETSAGLSKDKKFIIRLGNEKIAGLTLTDRNHATKKTDIPDWQLGEIELFFERNNTYYIKTLAGQQVEINGVALDSERNTIRMSTTRAGEYLPEGITAPYTAVSQVDGLMVKPQVTVYDVNGNQVETTYDEETRTFTVPAAGGQTMDADLQKRALSAIKTYAMYMSAKGGMETELAEYFQRGTDLFKTFTSMERTWNQRYKDHSFSDDKVTDYVRYTDEMFSARVSTNLHLVRSDRTEKVTELSQSMFFRKVQGKWKCFEMTAVDISEPVEKVRVTFKNGSQVIQSDMIDTNATTVKCPAVEVPAGKTFSGWVVEERNEDGSRVMRLTLQPDGDNISPAPAGGLKPMVLLPLFE